jgi:hypothetical protein
MNAGLSGVVAQFMSRYLQVFSLPALRTLITLLHLHSRTFLIKPLNIISLIQCSLLDQYGLAYPFLVRATGVSLPHSIASQSTTNLLRSTTQHSLRCITQLYSTAPPSHIFRYSSRHLCAYRLFYRWGSANKDQISVSSCSTLIFFGNAGNFDRLFARVMRLSKALGQRGR